MKVWRSKVDPRWSKVCKIWRWKQFDIWSFDDLKCRKCLWKLPPHPNNVGRGAAKFVLVPQLLMQKVWSGGKECVSMHQMLQNLENRGVPSWIFLVKSSHFASDLHYSGSTGELQDAVPLPNLDLQMPPTNSNWWKMVQFIFLSMQDRQDDKALQLSFAILRKTMGQDFVNAAACNLDQLSLWKMM